MAEYKGLTIKFTGDDTDLTRALMNIENKADDTQKTLSLIGSGKGLGLKQGGDALKSFGDSVSKLGDKLTIISGAMLLTFGRKMVQSVQEFGNEVSKIGGYLGVSGDELEDMRQLALKFGKDTQYSATEAAEAISELAKGGLDQAQISSGALEATLHLAAAGQMDFASAAKVTSQALHAFRLEGEDAEHVADALAAAATNSVASVEGLSNGFAYAASWARNAGWSINEVSGALALLSNYGIDAEMAGTALRNFMLRLAAPTDKAAGLMADLGIEVRDANGNMKSAVEVIDELNGALGNLSADERDSLINAIFGVRGANAALALMDAGSQELQKYIGYTYDVGAAARMAQAQMGDLGWAIELMRGEAETASVNFMSSLEPTLIKLANAAEDLFSWFNELSDAERDNVVRMAMWTVGAGPFLSIVGRLVSGFGSVVSTIGSLTMGISGLVKGLSVWGATGTQVLGSAISAAKMTSVAEGIGMASAALAGLKAGLIGIAVVLAGGVILKSINDLRKAEEEAELAAERVRLLDDASSALSRTARNSSPDVEKAADSYRKLGEAADTSNDAVDKLMESHLRLAEQIEGRNSGAQESINLLSTAKGIIHDYAGEEHLAADEVAKLQWALELVNQETGHNYELMYSYSGIVGENGEAVDNLVESLDDLIDARMREAQAAAISANITDLYKEQYELERERAAVETELARQRATADQIRRDMAELDPFWDDDEYTRMSIVLDGVEEKIGGLEQSLGGLDGALADNADGIQFYTDEYAKLYGELDTVEKKLGFIKQAVGADVFGGLGDRADEFVSRFDSALGKVNKKLEESGQAQLDYTSFTADQWAALVTALNADGYYMEDMLALITGNFELSTSNWGAIVTEWADGMGIPAEDAMAALSQGIRDGEITVNGSLDEILESAVGYVKENAPKMHDGGEAMTGEVASGIESEDSKSLVRNAVAVIKKTAEDTFNSGDTETIKLWGKHLASSYAEGIRQGRTTVVGAVNDMIMDVKSRLHFTRPDIGDLRYVDTWGKHLAQAYAGGIKSGLPYIKNAADSVADTIAWGVNDNSLYMSAGTGNVSGTVINIDGNAIVTDARMRAAADSFLQEVARKADM